MVSVVTLLANSSIHDKDKGNEKQRFNKQVGGGEGVIHISSDRDYQMGAKTKLQKKSLDQKLTPNKSHAKFLSLKSFQKALII